jgi:hypothetical protein
MGKVTVKEITYGQWGNCIEVSNGIIDLIATLDFGPRIIRFGLVGRENEFFEDKELELTQGGEQFNVFGGGEWHIYGGHRLWHSPEVSPRSYYPDNSKVSWTEVENGIKLRPEEEKWNQMQKEIEIIMSPESAKVKVIHRITNTGAWDVEFAPWALSVMAPGGKEVVPQPQRDTGLLGNRILALWPYTKMNDKRVYWGDKFITLQQDPNAEGPFKFGLTNEDGWAAYFNHNNMFVKYYKHNKDGVYPDFGVSYETYTNKFMLEIESLGELKRTAPGETVEHIEEWEIFADVPVPSNDEGEIKAIVSKYIKK